MATSFSKSRFYILNEASLVGKVTASVWIQKHGIQYVIRKIKTKTSSFRVSDCKLYKISLHIYHRGICSYIAFNLIGYFLTYWRSSSSTWLVICKPYEPPPDTKKLLSVAVQAMSVLLYKIGISGRFFTAPRHKYGHLVLKRLLRKEFLQG